MGRNGFQAGRNDSQERRNGSSNGMIVSKYSYMEAALKECRKGKLQI